MPINSSSIKTFDLDETEDFFHTTKKSHRFSLASRLKPSRFNRNSARKSIYRQQRALLSDQSCTSSSTFGNHIGADKNGDDYFNVNNKMVGNPVKYSNSTFDCIEERINTRFGKLLVARQGAKSCLRRPIIITYHDLGLNYIANFEGFLTLSDNSSILNSFTIYHINCPGQEAEKLNHSYVYPSMDELAMMINDVLDYYKIKCFIGFGCGLGANVLTRFALLNPEQVEGLFLINPIYSQSSWREWFWTKRNIRSLISSSKCCLPENVQNYLLWYHFGDCKYRSETLCKETIDVYKTFFKGKALNPHNFRQLLNSYVKRTPLRLSRGCGRRQLKCQTLLITGSASPHLGETIILNSRLDPVNTSWLRIDGCAMVLEEKPHAVSQALHLFIQGLGYPLKDFRLKNAKLAGLSLPNVMASCMSISSLPSSPNTPSSPMSAQHFFA